MHILLLSHNYPFSDDPTFGFFCKQQAEALVLHGHRVGVICPLAYSIPRIIIRRKRFLAGTRISLDNSVRAMIFFFPSPPKLKRLKLFLIERIGRYLLEKYIRKYGIPDIIHLHVFYPAKVAEYARNKYKVPIVWTEHFSDFDRGRLTTHELKLLSIAAEVSKIRIAVSENFQKSLEAKLRKDFHYVPNVYNSFLFQYRPEGKPADVFSFIHVANLDSNKNQMRLLDAFKKSFHGREKIKLVIIGEGEDCEMLNQYVSDNQLERQVFLKGFMEAENVYKELCNAHAFVLSSDYETFGVSLIEAMACGLPAVATKSGGPESIITDAHLGLLVDKTVDSLGSGMEYILNNYSLYDPEKIASTAKRNYSYEAIGARLSQLYSRCR